MLEISATREWHVIHPGAAIGLLELSGVNNVQATSQFDLHKREIERRLREQYASFTRQDLTILPVMAAYRDYYRQFKKTYHVLLQVESIVQKGRSLPNVSPLVDANFMAEVETLVLTAGHDAAKLQAPVVIDVSREGDQMTQMYGETIAIRAGDMVMRDANGISCSIIYGQDNRSPISFETQHVLYVAYAPPGVSYESVEAQLEKILELIRLFSPAARVEQQRLLVASPSP